MSAGASSPRGDAPGANARTPRSGLLAIDKSPGMTSHDVVRQIRRHYKVSAGHLGTLDPGASGLLLVAMGAATRCALAWQGGEKTYEATVRFGVVTATQDLEGDVLETHEPAITEAQVREASKAFEGGVDQIPPMVSAIKVGGERLYKMARRGETIERPARRIRISEWVWLAFDLPEARFRVRCSGGTYVRTLAHDLGRKLGCGGALASLRRLRSEPFGLERAVTLEALQAGDPEALWDAHAYSMEEAFAGYPSVRLDEAGATSIGFGGPAHVSENAARDLPLEAGPRSIVLLDGDGQVLGLGELTPGETPATFVAAPHVMFPWGLRESRS